MTLGDFASSFTREFTPGPGAYTTETHNSVGSKYSIHCNIRPKYGSKPPLTSEIDFPKEYSSISKHGKTISPKYNARDSADGTPGPEYLPDPKELFHRSVCIKKKYDESGLFNNPGPGTYSPGELSKTRIPPMCGRSKIVLSDIPDSPGPSAYDVLHQFGGSPKYTIRPKTAEPEDRGINPGMMYNNPGKLGEGTPRWTFSKSQKLENNDRKIPGPGAYQQTLPRGSRIAPCIRPKTAIKEVEYIDVPLKDTRSFPQIERKTIGIKTENDFWGAKNKNPGPDFLPDSSLSRRSLTIGEKFKKKDIQDSPGPSDYNPHDTRIPREPLYTVKGPMARDDWLPKKKDEPGPGQYNIKCANDKPKWIIGERSISRTNRSQSSQREVLTSRKAKTSLR